MTAQFPNDLTAPDATGADHLEGQSHYHTALIHLFRGEMQRMTVWRTRLDTTSHWAILMTTGTATLALGSSAFPHYIMLLGLAILSICSVIEGRRYQHLHHSKWRISLLEHNYFARLLCPADPAIEPTWKQQLASDLVRPHYTMGLGLATRLRLRRNYLMLFYFVTAVWLTKVDVHPQNTSDIREFFDRLAVGQLLPSWFVAASAFLFVIGVTLLAVLTPSEETLENWTRARRAELVVGANGHHLDAFTQKR